MTGASAPVLEMQSRAAATLALYVTLPDGGPAARALLARLARVLIRMVGQYAPAATTHSALTLGEHPLSGPVTRQIARVPGLADWPVTQRPAPAPAPALDRLPSLLVDPGAHEVTLAGRVVPMTHKEFGLLEYLLRAPHRAVTREELLAEVWRKRARGNGVRTIDVHVRRLREKLGGFLQIVTVRGVGYRCDPTPEVVLVGSGDAD